MLTYFLKLLKFDKDRKLIWDRNAEILFNKEVRNIFEKVYVEFEKVEKSILILIDENNLLDLSLFNNEFNSINKYLTKNILTNPLLTSKDFIERLEYSNEEKVYNVLNSYNQELNKTRDMLIVKKNELQLLWDQKVIDLIWNGIRNIIYNSLTEKESKLSKYNIIDYCNYQSNIIYKKIYSDIINETKLFNAVFEVDINSHFEIRNNIIPKIQDRKFSFKEKINKVIEREISLKSLKTFNISDVSRFMDDSLQRRLTELINEMPKLCLLKNMYKRFIGRIVLLSLPLLLIGANYAFPFNFIEDPQTRKGIQLILNSKFFILASVVLLIFMILLHIRSRLKMKRDIRLFIQSTFKSYGEELFVKFQTNFLGKIKVTK